MAISRREKNVWCQAAGVAVSLWGPSFLVQAGTCQGTPWRRWGNGGGAILNRLQLSPEGHDPGFTTQFPANPLTTWKLFIQLTFLLCEVEGQGPGKRMRGNTPYY